MLTVTTPYLTPKESHAIRSLYGRVRSEEAGRVHSGSLLLASSNIPLSALILSHSRLTDPKSTQQRKSSIRNTLTRIKSHVTRSSRYLHVASMYFNYPKLGFDHLRVDYNQQKQIFLRTGFFSKTGHVPIM
jgi:hypothetical protein